MENIAYIRVSTVDQNEERQIESLKKYKIDKWFIEKVSGKDTNRPELNKLREYAREGDTVYIHDLSRLARNTQDLLQLVNGFESKGIKLVSNKENIDTSTAIGKLMLTMMGAIAEFERANLLEHQSEGISIAKSKGKYKGRKPVDISEFDNYYGKYMRRELSKSQLARELHISRPTLDKLIRNYEMVHCIT